MKQYLDEQQTAKLIEENRSHPTARKEKAHSLGEEYFPSANNMWARPNFEAQWVSEACMRMAEWEHKRLVDMACEWLKENIDLYTYISYSRESGHTKITLTDEFETAFKKAMEE